MRVKEFYCMLLGGYGQGELYRGFAHPHDRQVYMERVLTSRYLLEIQKDDALGLDFGWPRIIPHQGLAERIEFVLERLDWYEVKLFMMPIIES